MVAPQVSVPGSVWNSTGNGANYFVISPGDVRKWVKLPKMRRSFPSGFKMARVYGQTIVFGIFEEQSFTVICEPLKINRTFPHSSSTGISTILAEILRALGHSPKTEVSALRWFGLDRESVWKGMEEKHWRRLGAVFSEPVRRERPALVDFALGKRKASKKIQFTGGRKRK